MGGWDTGGRAAQPAAAPPLPVWPSAWLRSPGKLWGLVPRLPQDSPFPLKESFEWIECERLHSRCGLLGPHAVGVMPFVSLIPGRRRAGQRCGAGNSEVAREFHTRGRCGEHPAEAAVAMGWRLPGHWIANEWGRKVTPPPPRTLLCGGLRGGDWLQKAPGLKPKGEWKPLFATYIGDDPGSREKFASPGRESGASFLLPLEAQHELPPPPPFFMERLNFTQVGIGWTFQGGSQLLPSS